MWIVLKVLGIIWLASLLVIGIAYLWAKITHQPFVEEYDGDDF